MQEFVILNERSRDLLLALGHYFLHIYTLRLRIDTLHTHIHLVRHVALLVDLDQAWREVRHIIQFLRSRIIVEVQLLASSLLASVVLRQQTDLLRCTSTLMLRIGIGINTFTTLLCESLNSLPCLLRTFKIINTVCVALTKRLLRDAFHLLPIALQTRSQHQEVVRDLAVLGSRHLVPNRINCSHGILYPFNPAGHTILLLLPNLIRLVNTRSDQGKSRLIELTIAGINQCNIWIVQPAFQTGSHTDTGSTTTDNHDFTLRITGERMCFIRAQTCHQSACGKDAEEVSAVDTFFLQHF